MGLLGAIRRHVAEQRVRRRIGDTEIFAVVAERTRAIVLEVAGPLVEAGDARIDWGDRSSLEADQEIELTPTRPDAAPISILIDFDLVNLSPGLQGGTVELFADLRGSWENDLRFALQAVISGRYSEELRRGALAERLRMVFETPDGGESWKPTHYSSFTEFEPGVRRYGPYA